MTQLTDEMIASVAAANRVDPALVAAVIMIEAIEPRLSDGRLKILFEPYWFYRLSKVGRVIPKYCASSWSMVRDWGYGSYAEQYRRRDQAAKLDRQAAMKSCSIGPFQLMVFNYSAAGYSTPDQMWTDHEASDENALHAIFRWWENNGALLALQNEDIEAFSRVHNGAGYAAHNYHGRLRAAWNKCKPRFADAINDTVTIKLNPYHGVTDAGDLRGQWDTTIVRGFVGPAAKELRTILDTLDYDVDGPGPTFGPKTEEAVKLFQTHNALTVDGIVGPITWTALYEALEDREPEPETKLIDRVFVWFNKLWSSFK